MSRKPRVSVISLKWDGVAYYRGFLPFEELDNQGLIEFVDNRQLYEADVVVLERIFLPSCFPLIHELKRHGIRLIYQIDDDPFNIPPHHPSYQTYQKREVKDGLFYTLQTVDRIIAATEPLKQVLQQRLGAKVPITVIGNSLDFGTAWNPERYAPTPPLYRQAGKLVIGWAGALGHQADLQLLRGVFGELTRIYHDRLLFRFLGYHPDFIDDEALPGQAEKFPWVDVHNYPESLHALAFDIGLIPLVDNVHNRSKTNLKFLEFSALPVPSIISKVGPYRTVPADCAVLVENKFGKWVQAIRRLIDNEAEREALRRRAQAHVRAHYDISAHTAPWLEAIMGVEPDLNRSAFNIWPVAAPPHGAADSIDIIVPIHNAYEETVCCIQSVRAHTDLRRHRLLLVNDGSTDARMAPYLEDLARNASGESIQIIHHDVSQGFIRSCNEAMRIGSNDVVLLNSDTIVPARWLEKLRDSAYSHPSIGTVTPFSNNATILTIPIAMNPAEGDLGPQLEAINAVLEQQAEPYCDLPTGIGFCFYIKRDVLNKYGLFDEAFGRGYGEENDLCLRIMPEYKSVADTRTFVYHRGEASFSAAAAGYKQENTERLNQRYPAYKDMVNMWCASDPLMRLRLEVVRAGNPRPRILHVLHSFQGYAGTELFTANLARAFADRFEAFLVYPQQGTLVLNNLNGLVHFAPIPESYTRNYLERDKRIERAFLKYLEWLQPEIVHFQHLALLPMSLPRVAQEFGARVVFTLHDNFPLCPDPFLMDRPSSEHCTDIQKCVGSGCFTRKFGLPGVVAHRRREVMGEVLRRHCDRVVVPSRYMQEMAENVFGARARYIPHGIAIPAVTRRPSAKQRLGYLGNLSPIKGFQLLIEAFKRIQDRQPDTELHLYGNFQIQDMAGAMNNTRIILHGMYTPDQLPNILAEIDVAAIPSLAPESYCYTLSELSSAGIPTLVSRVGALPERVHPEMVFEPNIRALAEKLLQVLSDPALQQAAAAYARAQVTPLADQWAAYAALYGELTTGPREIRSEAAVRQGE